MNWIDLHQGFSTFYMASTPLGSLDCPAYPLGFAYHRLKTPDLDEPANLRQRVTGCLAVKNTGFRWSLE